MSDKLAVIQGPKTVEELKKIEAEGRKVVSMFKDMVTQTNLVNRSLNTGRLREFNSALQELNRTTQQHSTLERQLADAMERTARLEREQARLATEQARTRRELAAAEREESRARQQATREAAQEARQTRENTSAHAQLTRETRQARQTARDYGAEMIQLRAKLRQGTISQREYRQQMAELSRDFRTSTREAIRLERELRRLNQQTLPSGQRNGALQGRVNDILKGVLGAGAISNIANTLVGIATDAYETVKALDAQNLALKSVFETEAQIAFQKEYLSDLTNKYGLELVSTTDAYVKYSAAVKGTYLEGEQARKIFDSFSGASAKLGLSAEQSTGIFKSLEQMISKGKIQAEELRGQLGDRMAGAFKLFADGMGVSTAELDKMLKSGTVIADDVLPKVAERLSKVYDLNTAGNIDTIAAAQNRLKNEWTSFLSDFTDNKDNVDFLAGSIEALSYGVKFLLDILVKDGAAGREIITGLIDVLGSLVEALGTATGITDTTSSKMEKFQATLAYVSADVNILASAIKYLTSIVSNFFSTMFVEDGWDKFNDKMEKSADSLINSYKTWDKVTNEADRLFTGLTPNERAIREREEETKRYKKSWDDAKASKAAYFNYKGKYFATATGRNTGKSLDDYIDIGSELVKKQKTKKTDSTDDKKPKKYTGAKLDGYQKDRMNILQAERDNSIAEITQQQNEGLINEQQFQEKRIEIIKNYAAKVQAFLKGSNAKERQIEAATRAKASAEIKSSLKEQYDYFQKNAENTFQMNQNTFERQSKALENNDFLTNTERLDKQIELDGKILESTTKFYEDQIALAKRLNQDVLSVERKRDEEIGKIQDARSEKIRSKIEAHIKDLETESANATFVENISFEEQKRLILSNKKLSNEEKTYRISLLEIDNQIKQNNLKIAELKALKAEYDLKVAMADLQGQKSPEFANKSLETENQIKGLETNNAELNNEAKNLVSEKTQAIRDAVTQGFKTIGFEQLGDAYSATMARLKNDTASWKDYAVLAATAVLESLSKLNDKQKEKTLANLDEQLKYSQETAEQETEFINGRLEQLNALEDLTAEQMTERAKLEDEARVVKEQQQQREKLIETQKAKAEQKAAAQQALINGALAATMTLAQMGFIAGAIPAALALAFGIAQSVAIMSKDPTPKYWKGRKGGKAEFAWTQEKGAEVITDKHDNIKSLGSGNGAKMTWLDAGDKVYTASESKDILKMMGPNTKIGNRLIKRSIQQSLQVPIVNVSVNQNSSNDNRKFESAVRKAFKDFGPVSIRKEKGLIIKERPGYISKVVGKYDLKTGEETWI